MAAADRGFAERTLPARYAVRRGEKNETGELLLSLWTLLTAIFIGWAVMAEMINPYREAVAFSLSCSCTKWALDHGYRRGTLAKIGFTSDREFINRCSRVARTFACGQNWKAKGREFEEILEEEFPDLFPGGLKVCES